MSASVSSYTGFVGHRLIARGSIDEVARGAKALVDEDVAERIAIFDDATGQPIDLDYRGLVDEVIARLADHPMVGLAQPATPAEPERRKGPGRPRLGVVAREVTLLPRHWEWLKTQRGGASATLRRLVEAARREGRASDRAAQARMAVHRFTWDMASDLPGFEAATRAFDAKDYAAFFAQLSEWPEDVRAHVAYLVERLIPLEQEVEPQA